MGLAALYLPRAPFADVTAMDLPIYVQFANSQDPTH
ncbi:hypothetical protein V1280_000625 [Bradyrhizobium sp. AZCC 2230]